MIHAAIAAADGQYAKSYYDTWGPNQQNVLFPRKYHAFPDVNRIAQQPAGLLLEATPNVAQHEPSVKAHCPADQPNRSPTNVNTAGTDHPEVVDAVTNEYVAFYGH